MLIYGGEVMRRIPKCPHWSSVASVASAISFEEGTGGDDGIEDSMWSKSAKFRLWDRCPDAR